MQTTTIDYFRNNATSAGSTEQQQSPHEEEQPRQAKGGIQPPADDPDSYEDKHVMSSTCSSSSSSSSFDSSMSEGAQRMMTMTQQLPLQLGQQLHAMNQNSATHTSLAQPPAAKAVHFSEPESVGSAATHHHDGSSSQHKTTETLPQHVQVKQENSRSSGTTTDMVVVKSEQPDENSIHYHRFQVDTLLHNLSISSVNGRLLMINLSRRGLAWQDANAIREAMQRNPHLSVLKLSYNELGDRGTAIIAAGFLVTNGSTPTTQQQLSQSNKHPSLTVLDLGFNVVGDAGCATLALHAVAGNYKLDTLYLSGNHFQQKGAMAVAGAILHGCNLSELHLSANNIGMIGVQALARAIAEREALVARERETTGAAQQYKTMQKLHLVGIDMGHEGFVTLSSMLLTNFSITTLCLSNNGVDDNGMALLAQSLSRNKNVPLEVIQLSFNEITCAGVECFMNAVWGSQVLKEIRFDNNKLRDRGAQLAAVALTAIPLETIDLSFNKITTGGIKALMKSLSENASLQYLGLSGINIDPNASKALSYGLAYNSTLKYLHVDNCQIGYAAQRHIIAGVISNRLAALRVLTGFTIGAIAVTLGLPKPLEGWTNDQCLSFTRLMWKLWRDENGLANKPLQLQAQALKRMGPAPPPAVVKASRMAFQVIGANGAESLNTEDHQKDVSQTSPLVHTNDTMLERSMSGTLRVPTIAQEDAKQDIEGWKNGPKVRSLQPLYPQVDPEQKNRNLQWLRSHFQSLHQVGQLPFNEADLWQLHQYFFSPLVPNSDSEDSGKSSSTSSTEMTKTSGTSSERQSPVPSAVLSQQQPQLQVPPTADATPSSSARATNGGMSRALSFQTLGDQAAVSSTYSMSTVSTKRRSLGTMEEQDYADSTSSDEEQHQPATKRARNFKPRIAYYPRIREMLESMGTKQSQLQILGLLRQLKFVEGIMFEGRNVYTDAQQIHETSQSTPTDVEMIILDLL